MLTTHQPHITHGIFHKEQSLYFSMLIQTAYEKEKPLSIVYQMEERPYQFCGYIDQIDPAERWIRLRNGCLLEAIHIPYIISIDIL